MKDIIGILVCVNYSPILAISLAYNAPKLKHIYVVTKQEDIKTQETCKSYGNVSVLFHDFEISENWCDVVKRRVRHRIHTKDFAEDIFSQFNRHKKNAFNKGGALRLGQQIALRNFPRDFYLILDCDIVISDDLTTSMQDMVLETDVLYTTERRDYSSNVDFNAQQNWQRYQVPIAGYFQLYKTSKPIYYEDWHTAGKCDMWFAWDIIGESMFHHRVKTLPGHVDHLGASGKGKYNEGTYDFDFKL